MHLNRVDGFHKGSEACYAYEQPFMASYANIMDINAITTDENKVYVVENEMVFSYLVKEMKNKHIAIICTSGQLSSTAQKSFLYLRKVTIKSITVEIVIQKV